MRIKIMSDSTCDLPEAYVRQNDILLFPLNIIKDSQTLKDGITITPADIFAHVAAGGDLCTTSACNVSEYAEVFEEYASQYDGIIQISLGAEFSSSYQNACIAAEDYPNIRVIDSQSLSCGQGLIVLKACELAEQGKELDAIVQELKDYIPKIEGSFIIDHLDYLAKGGRCSTVSMLGANLLSLKPCIELRDGRMSVGKKYRGQYTSCVQNYIRERLEKRDDIDWSTVFYVKTVISDESDAAARNTLVKSGHFDNQIDAIAGCTISCHCGPGTMGIMFARK